jgi:hypothetical protein
MTYALSNPRIGGWWQGRAQRKADDISNRVRDEYCRVHRPENYEERRAEYDAALDDLEVASTLAISKIKWDLAIEQGRLDLSTRHTNRAVRARIDALRAMLEAKRLEHSTAVEQLTLKYRDILEYDETLASL